MAEHAQNELKQDLNALKVLNRKDTSNFLMGIAGRPLMTAALFVAGYFVAPNFVKYKPVENKAEKITALDKQHAIIQNEPEKKIADWYATLAAAAVVATVIVSGFVYRKRDDKVIEDRALLLNKMFLEHDIAIRHPYSQLEVDKAVTRRRERELMMV